jgi:chromosome condensin MukBEF ATPase and DNA-binding subunit MukB
MSRVEAAANSKPAEPSKRNRKVTVSDAAKKGERLLRKLPLGKDQGQNNIQESQRHLLNLIEVLMNELQKLRTTLSEEKRQHKILTDYIIAAQDVNRAEIVGLTEKLNAERSHQQQLREKIAQLIGNTLNDPANTPVVLALLKNVEQIFQESTPPPEPLLSENFISFPTFTEWLEKAKDEVPLDLEPSLDAALMAEQPFEVYIQLILNC